MRFVQEKNPDGLEKAKEILELEPEQPIDPEEGYPNLLVELGHRKEDTPPKCPDASYVIDIWGYCRQIFHEERRDWNWWRNVRQYVHAQGNSGHNTYLPTAYMQGKK